MPKHRLRPGAWAWIILGAMLARPVWAAPAELVMGGSEVDPQSGVVSTVVGAFRSDGSPAKLEQVRLLFNGQEVADSRDLIPLSRYSTDHPKWTPPVCLGVVYLWSTASPQTLLDGVEALLRLLPPRMAIYPTPYGQGYRPVIAAVAAARAASGELGSYPPIPGNQSKLLDALRFNIGKLMGDEAPLRSLVLVSDGHDYRDSVDAGGFVVIGEELRQRGISLDVVALRSPGDPGHGIENLRGLVQTAHGRMIEVDRPTDLAPAIESLAERWLGMRYARFELPWRRRALGGRYRLGLIGRVEGTEVKVQDIEATLPGSGAWFWVVALAALGLGTVAAVWGRPLLARLRQQAARGGDTRDDALLQEVQELIRVGLPAERAALELCAGFRGDVSELLKLDPHRLSGSQYRYLQTRAGQARLREIQAVLRDLLEEPTLDEETAQLLSSAIGQKMAPDSAAKLLRARSSSRQWSALARASQDELSRSFNQAKEDFPELAKPGALSFALQVVDALQGPEPEPVCVGWLVRASGPGLRGQTIKIPNGGGRVGQGSDCSLRLQDGALKPRHADILQQGGAFVIRPLDGSVRVEGAELSSSHVLVDGETVEMGSGRYVFKSVT